ncbi:MAG: hypothetical protein IKJ69_04475 [Clostridia bacterium]|nr:hypothetical protein [Clostridia bacterium]
MAKKLLCVVLSVAMLLGTFAIVASAGDCYPYTAEEVEAEMAEKLWEEEYDADVDYKDLINRKWLTGIKEMGKYDSVMPATAASAEVIEQNIQFWDDEIIEAYYSASTNEEFWTLYNKMNTPLVVEYDCEWCGLEYDILYDWAYEYKAEEKATVDLEIVADKEYAKAGDTITVDVYATSNFYTLDITGGIFYDKQYLEPVSVAFDTTAIPTWKETLVQLDGFVTAAAGDLRENYWPDEMCNEEDLAKYGFSYFEAVGNTDLGVGNYVSGLKLQGERLFTATYTVKEDVPEGTELKFFLPTDVTLSIEEILVSEMEDKSALWILRRVVYPDSTADLEGITTDNHFCYGQTVTANTEIVTIGEEPAPAVKGEIVNVNVADTYIGDTAVVGIEVTGSPDLLRVTSGDGYQVFTRDDADITATENGENWVIELLVAEEEVACTVFADYGDLGVTDGTDFVLVGLVKQDLGVYSIEIPDMYPNAQNGGIITAGKHQVIIKTSVDVTKVQFYDESDGTTYTYPMATTEYEDIDGERVWKINHAFGPFGTRSLVVRTRSATTFFAATDATLDATVVY